MKKEKAFITVQTVEINYSPQQQNLIVELDGLLFLRLYQGRLKLKLIIVLAGKELNTIALSVEHIMVMFLMTAQENQVKDFAIMGFV
jgi:hypothetical protein